MFGVPAEGRGATGSEDEPAPAGGGEPPLAVGCSVYPAFRLSGIHTDWPDFLFHQYHALYFSS